VHQLGTNIETLNKNTKMEGNISMIEPFEGTNGSKLFTNTNDVLDIFPVLEHDSVIEDGYYSKLDISSEV
jgi:hypothetical protein